MLLSGLLFMVVLLVILNPLKQETNSVVEAKKTEVMAKASNHAENKGVDDTAKPVLPEKEKKTIDKNQKVVALTFDDGPHNKTTPIILEEFKKYDGHATFFVIGSRLNQYSDVLLKTYQEGHEIGNHTWNHPNLKKVTTDTIAAEVQRTQKEVERITGYTPTIIRPPYGSYDERLNAISDMDIVLWSVDPEDWKNKSRDVIVNRVLSKISDESVVLMHDIHSATASAIPIILSELHKQGYQFVTVSELEEIKKDRAQ